MPAPIHIQYDITGEDPNAIARRINRAFQDQITNTQGGGSGIAAAAREQAKLMQDILNLQQRGEATRLTSAARTQQQALAIQQAGDQKLEQQATKHQQSLLAIEQAGDQKRQTQAVKAATQQNSLAAEGAARLFVTEQKTLNQLLTLEQEHAAKRQVIEAGLQDKLAQISQRAATRRKEQGNILGALTSPQIREAGESIQQAGFAFQFLTNAITGLASASVQSALNFDKQVKALTPLVGSAEKAERRFNELVAISQKTPGLTTNIAIALEQQARVAQVSEGTINKLLQTIGRLNAVQSIGDPQEFANNLRQLVTGGFDKADLKQLAERSAIGGQLMAGIFNVDSPTNGEAIRAAAKKMGITTFEQLAAAFAEAGARDTRLKNVTESLQFQLEKAFENIALALRPLGTELLAVLVPAVQATVPIVQELLSLFAQLPQPVQTLIIVLGGLAAALSPVLIAFGGLIQMFQVIKGLQAFQTVAAGLLATQTAAATAAPAMLTAGTAAVTMEAELAAAGTTIGTTAASFSLLGPVILALVAILAIATAAWLLYDNSLSKATETATKQIPTTLSQISALKASQDALAQKTVTTGQLNDAIALLDPAEQEYTRSLKTQEEQVARVNEKLRERAAIQRTLLEAQALDLINNLLPTVQAYNQQRQALDALTKQYKDAEKNVKEFGQSGEQLTGFMGELTTVGQATREEFQRVSESVRLTGAESARLANEIRPVIDGLIKAGGSAEGARVLVQKFKDAGLITAETANVMATAINRFAAEASAAGNAAGGAVPQIQNLAAAIKEAGISGVESKLKRNIEVIAANAKGDLRAAQAEIQKQGLDVQAKELTQAQKVASALEKQLNLVKQTHSGVKAVTAGSEITRTTRQVERLRLEIDALQQGGGVRFQLELRQSELELAKQQLTEILKLRNQLGVNLSGPLPKDVTGREAEIRNLQREKQARDEIVRLQEAEADALIRLRVERERAIAPLVSEETRTALAVLEHENELRKQAATAAVAEREANARLVVTLAQLALIRRDAGRLQRAQITDQLEAATKAGAELEGQVSALQSSQVQTELQRLGVIEAENDRLRQQAEALKQIGTLTGKLQDKGLTPNQQNALNRATLLQQQDQLRTQAPIDESQIFALEQRLKDLQAGAVGEVNDALNKARLSRLQSQFNLTREFEDLAKQEADNFIASEEFKTNALKSAQVERIKDRQATHAEFLRLIDEEQSHYIESEQFKLTAFERAENQRRNATRALAEENIRLQNEIAHAGEDAALRTQNAYLKAIREIQEADEQARESMIKSRVKLADATVFHAERSNAKVLEFLANETKGLTDIVADAKIGIIKDAFSAVDDAIGKLVEHFGVLKGFIAEILSGLAKMLLSKAFQVIFGLNAGGGGGGGFGGGGGGGGGGLGGFLNLLTGGRGSGGGGFNFGNISAGGGGGGSSSFNFQSLADAFTRQQAPQAPNSLTTPFGNFGLKIPSLNVPGGGFSSAAKVGGFSGNFLGGGLVSLLPAFIGAGIGAQFGGKSVGGQILGAIGGAAAGIGVSLGASVFGALGGGLGALGPAALAALGPIALVALPLIIGAILLGRSKQRKADEEASGEFLQNAIDATKELRKQAEQGNLTDEAKARDIFENQIIGTFTSQISGLKTKSVRDSRLTNQVADLRALFEAEVIPAIKQAAKDAAIFKKQIPEFHSGGLAHNETLAVVLRSEMILTQQQQHMIQHMAGFNVFAAAGVPGAVPAGPDGLARAHSGGFFSDPRINHKTIERLLQEIGGAGPHSFMHLPTQPVPVATSAPVVVVAAETGGGPGAQAAQPLVINIAGARFSVGPGDATELLGLALTTSDGRSLVVGVIDDAEDNGGGV